MLKKKLALYLISAMVVANLMGCSSNKVQAAEPTSASTSIEKQVTKGEIKEEISLSGSIKATKIATVSGEDSVVEEIYVQSNEEVLAGEDLLLLENGNVLEAPIDGKITKINVTEGETISANTTVFNLADSSSYCISAYIDEEDITKVKLGQEVDVTVTAINKALTGKITAIDGEATSSGNSTTFGITITLEGDFEDVYSGMSSEMNIIINESTDALLVPVDAVKKANGKYVVSLKEGESTKDVEVEIGLQDSSYVEIKSGLNEGDTVVYTQAAKSTSNPTGAGGMGQMQGGMPSDMQGGGMGGGQIPSGGQMPSGMSGGKGSN